MRAQLCLLIFFLVSGCANLQFKRTQPASILQGLTSEDSAEFNIIVTDQFSGTFKVKDHKGEYYSPTIIEKQTLESEDKTIYQVWFKLPPHLNDSTLQLVIFQDHTPIETRSFNLFKNKETKLKFLIASCMDQEHPDKDIMWEKAVALKPEIIFLIGDNFYFKSQPSSEQGMVEAWLDYRLTNPLFKQSHLIPVHAVWDDNDYGMNNGDETFKLKDSAQKLFKLFFAQNLDQTYIDRGPGIASRLHLRGMHFNFLDNRSFRQNTPQGQHLGPAQIDWLMNGLEKALPSWIISGDQFFGAYHTFESYAGNHPEEFKTFTEKLKTIQSPFIFVSGDRHLSEIMHFPASLLGQISYELTTSPMHSKVYPESLLKMPNPWRVSGIDDQSNFLLVETQLLEKSWDIDLSFIGKSESPLIKRNLTLFTDRLKEITIDKKIPRRRYKSRSRRR